MTSVISSRLQELRETETEQATPSKQLPDIVDEER